MRIKDVLGSSSAIANYEIKDVIHALALMAMVTGDKRFHDAASAANDLMTKSKPSLSATRETGIARNAKKMPRAARKDTGPRERNVKERIVAYLSEFPDGRSAEAIINEFGFKNTTVRATLQSMKKIGAAMQDGPNWVLISGAPSGNGGASEARV